LFELQLGGRETAAVPPNPPFDAVLNRSSVWSRNRSRKFFGCGIVHFLVLIFSKSCLVFVFIELWKAEETREGGRRRRCSAAKAEAIVNVT
jgi:hypothetical protein